MAIDRMVDRICDNCMSRVPADSDKCPRCGIRFENTNPGGALPNGWVLGGRYTVGRYQEIDGEGVTYSAIDGNTLQRVIIKEFMPVTLCATRDENGSIVAKPGNEVLFKTTRMDFRELYDTLLRMGLNEGLVQVLDVLEENNTAYAVLEKVEGPTLAEYLTKNGDAPVEASRAMAILRPVMMGVENMHGANLVHRGICPENIILESGGSAKLAGYATLALRQQGSELKPKLYPGYSAPEQYAANEFEGRYTDIYAIGAVLYRLLTGEVPTPADERKMQDNLRPPRALNKDIPTFLSSGVARAMRMIPAERIQNVSDLRLALTGEGGRDARGPLGLTKQQLIVAGVSIGVIVVLVLVLVFVALFGGNKDKDESSSSSEPSTTTSLVSSVSGVENPMPNFVGSTLAFVEGRYGSDYDFDIRYEYSSTVDAGYIISQEPAQGSEYTGGKVVLYVSEGEDPAESSFAMPDFVTSKTLVDDAKKELVELGMAESRIIVSERTNEKNVEPGTVLETSPTPGTTVDISSGTVTLYVAGAKLVEMPNLTGYTSEAAADKLKDLGIEVASFDWASNPNGDYVYNTVNGASVEWGASIAQGTRVTLYMAKNPAMPDVVDVALNVAEERLAYIRDSAKGTKVSGLTWKVEYVESSKPSGVVIEASINTGEEIPSNANIILYVSGKGED